MKGIKEIITVSDRLTLYAAITPYELQTRWGLLRSRIIKKKADALKETFWVECRTHARKQTRELYQIEYIKPDSR